MPIVVRRETRASLDELVESVARGVIACSEQWAETERWRSAFVAWRRHAFGKVVLRARAGEWERLLSDFDCTVVGSVALLPPRRQDQRELLLRRMQLYVADPSRLRRADREAEAAVTLAVNPAITIGAGKLLAQAGHAAQLINDSSLRHDQRYAWHEWELAGRPFHLLDLPLFEWRRACADGNCIVVRDAGLTEVEAGTETIVAFPPRH